MRTRSWALTISHAVLLTATIASLGYCVYAVVHHLPYLAVRLAPGISVIGLPLLLRSRQSVRIIAAFLVVGLGAGLYLGQFALMLSDIDSPLLEAMRTEAWAARAAFDDRTRIEVIDDFRRRGTKAYPPYFPYLLLGSPLKIDGGELVPLGSMSNALTVCCNEGGQYMVYTTDEHGFVNPPGSWAPTAVDIAIVGASFAVGESLDPTMTPAAQIRRRYPRTVTLGAGGNGPLLELGAVREYLPSLKPKRVLWVFSESHSPVRLEEERHSELLLRYFEPSFRQGLIEKQDLIDHAIERYFEDGIRQARMEEPPPRLREFLFLESVRKSLERLANPSPKQPDPLVLDQALYEHALRTAKNTVESWGGAITLVYWPETSRYAGMNRYSPELRGQYDRIHDSFLAAANATGLAVIDLSQAFPDLPAAESDHNAEYFYSYPAHFKPAGYRRATQAILDRLAATP